MIIKDLGKVPTGSGPNGNGPVHNKPGNRPDTQRSFPA